MYTDIEDGGRMLARVVTQRGIKVVWGVRERMPIVGAPEGRQRLRMRNTSVAKLFVKTADSIRCFILEDGGDHWFVQPQMEQGANYRGAHGVTRPA